MERTDETKSPLTDEDSVRDDDWPLVERLRTGDLTAFEAIMRRHNQRLYRIARSVLRNGAEAEDVVQETYLKAFAKLSSFDGRGGFGHWLGAIALNEARGRLRLQGRVVAIDDYRSPRGENGGGDAMNWIKFNGPDPERLAMASELRKMIEKAVDELPEDFRNVFVLRVVEGMTTLETARLLAVPPETVKTRLHRARQRLQRSFGSTLSELMPTVHRFDGERCNRIVAHVMARCSPVVPDTHLD